MGTLTLFVEWLRARIASQVGLIPYVGSALEKGSPAACHRTFEIRLGSLPEDDGLAAPTAPRWRAEVLVRVFYRLEPDRLVSELEAAKDVALMATALLLQSGVAKVDGHDIPGAASTEILSAGSAMLVTVPLTVHYRS